MLVIKDGLISELRPSGDAVPDGAQGLEGDLLIPGLIDLHTDHLERHYVPRPYVRAHHKTGAGGLTGPVTQTREGGTFG